MRCVFVCTLVALVCASSRSRTLCLAKKHLTHETLSILVPADVVQDV